MKPPAAAGSAWPEPVAPLARVSDTLGQVVIFKGMRLPALQRDGASQTKSGLLS